MSPITWDVSTSNRRYVSTVLNTSSDTKWSGDFCFVQAADPQFGFHDVYKNPNYRPETADLTFELDLSKRAVEKVNKMNPKPRFFIVCGDLINELNNLEYSVELKCRQVEAFKNVFSKVDKDIPLVCVCGNHDVGDTPTKESIQSYKNEFGDDYFSFWCGGVFFIVLNSQLYKDDRYVQDLAKEQDEWLMEQLNRAAGSGSRIVCFSHVPVFVGDLNEDDSVYNIPLSKRIKLLETLYDAGVRHFFNGHYHRNGAVEYKDMQIVITSAIGVQLGNDRSGFRIVNVSEHDISHRYVDLMDD